MCAFKAPKIPKTPPAAERQAMQAPRDAVDQRTGLAVRRRRGMWASLFTSPQGVVGAPTVTGMSGGMTGG
jgi:hypothetical protein